MDRYVNTLDSEWYKQRIVGVSICALVAFVALFVRLIYLQVVLGEEYQRLSVNNSIRLQIVDPPRGLILDRNGMKLAENRPSFDVSFTPKDAGDTGRVLGDLSAHLEMPSDDLLGRVKNSKGLAAFKPVLLKQDIGRDVLAVVEARKVDLPGVQVNVRLRRNYLYGTSASHVIGYLGEINTEELKGGDFPGLRGGDYIGRVRGGADLRGVSARRAGRPAGGSQRQRPGDAGLEHGFGQAGPERPPDDRSGTAAEDRGTPGRGCRCGGRGGPAKRPCPGAGQLPVVQSKLVCERHCRGQLGVAPRESFPADGKQGHPG